MPSLPETVSDELLQVKGNSAALQQAAQAQPALIQEANVAQASCKALQAQIERMEAVAKASAGVRHHIYARNNQ